MYWSFDADSKLVKQLQYSEDGIGHLAQLDEVTKERHTCDGETQDISQKMDALLVVIVAVVRIRRNDLK